MTRVCLRLLFSGLMGFVPAVAVAQSQDAIIYFHTDAIGSVRMITDANGGVLARYDFTPFGVACGSACGTGTPPETIQFAGKERDADTALDYFGARYFESVTGRFSSPDPIRDPARSNWDLETFLTRPQRWNAYAYALNNPLRFTDPTGGEIPVWEARLSGGPPPGGKKAVSDIGIAMLGGALVTSGAAAAPTLAVEAQILIGRILLWAAGGAGVEEGLRRAAADNGPTVRVVTNLTQAPAVDRGIYTAVGENAQALANAFRSGEGVRTFAANIPKALVNGLQKAGLLRVSVIESKTGVRGTEYHFLPGAYQYIIRFFEEVPQ